MCGNISYSTYKILVIIIILYATRMFGGSYKHASLVLIQKMHDLCLVKPFLIITNACAIHTNTA